MKDSIANHVALHKVHGAMMHNFHVGKKIFYARSKVPDTVEIQSMTYYLLNKNFYVRVADIRDMHQDEAGRIKNWSTISRGIQRVEQARFAHLKKHVDEMTGKYDLRVQRTMSA